MQVTASAPGKLVLYGDHAVVHGQPGIATALNHRYQVQASRLDRAVLQIRAPGSVEREISLARLGANPRPATAFVEAAVGQLLARNAPAGGIRIVSDGPAQSFGLGSSSAITVATLAATARLLDVRLNRARLYDLARAAVLEVQGAGSGLDVAAAVHGGCVYLERSGARPERLSTPDLPLVIAWSGRKAGTTNLVRQVSDLRARHPDLVGPVLGLAGRICIRARACLEEGRWSDLGELTDIHQGLLDSLGVNTASLSRLIMAARNAGALGAKLSGAGGGDCIFALTEDSVRAKVVAALRAAGGDVLDIESNAPGVCIHGET